MMMTLFYNIINDYFPQIYIHSIFFILKKKKKSRPIVNGFAIFYYHLMILSPDGSKLNLLIIICVYWGWGRGGEFWIWDLPLALHGKIFLLMNE